MTGFFVLMALIYTAEHGRVKVDRMQTVLPAERTSPLLSRKDLSAAASSRRCTLTQLTSKLIGSTYWQHRG